MDTPIIPIFGAKTRVFDGAENEPLTIEKLREASRLLDTIKPPADLLSSYSGLRIFEDPRMVEEVTYDVKVARTWKQRWIDPISSFHNFQTMPFEPWVRFDIEQRSRTVPMKQAYRTDAGIVMHPVMMFEIKRAFANPFDFTKHGGPVC